MGRPTDIDQFDEYLHHGMVRETKPDPAQASSLLDGANRKYRNMERLGLSPDTATDYFENIYGAVKMLLQAFMANDGYKPYSHEAIIAYAIEDLGMTDRPAHRFNRCRKLRNDISYRGDVATLKEGREIRAMYLALTGRLEPELRAVLDTD